MSSYRTSLSPFTYYILRFSLRAADVFPVVASLPPKINICEPERQNDFRDVKPFQPITV